MAGAEPGLKNVRLDIRVQSPDSESDAQKIYESWRERCPIYLALTKAVEVSLNMETTQAQCPTDSQGTSELLNTP